jgi:opacity protein-like surface antigen
VTSRRTVVSIAVCAVLAFAAPGRAEAGDWMLSLDGGLRSMSGSADTQKAIFGDWFGPGFGAGVFHDRGRHWRFGVEGRVVDRHGERAIAADRNSEAYRLGHPLDFTMIEGVASISWRFERRGSWTPYAGVGGGAVSFKERSRIAGLEERASGSTALFELRAGAERGRGRFRYGLEGGVTFAPNAIGVGGISQIYEESDIGGVFVVARFAFSR